MMKNSTFIIAEAGVNHNGDLELAKQLVDAAASAKADAVKFQTFRAEHLVSHNTPKAEYQMHTTDSTESHFDMIRNLELPEFYHEELIKYSKSKGIMFLSTPFDMFSLNLLTKNFDLQTIKIPSGEITNAPLLLQIARTSKQVILSTGMSNLSDIEKALSVLAYGFIMQHTDIPFSEDFERAYASSAGQNALREKVTLLHCTSEYPAPFAEVNLKVMDTLSQAFGLQVGYSDHTAGIHIPVAAVARGAVLVEKHFTMDRNLPGPDHKASIEPYELKLMVEQIRDIELALGDGIKRTMPSEWKNREVVRKSLVSAKAIASGEKITPDNITCKRAGYGVSPFEYWNTIGETVTRDYVADEMI